MKRYKIVIDTNVIFAGLYSNRGKSFKLLQLLENENIEFSISVPLLLEYEDVLKRSDNKLGLTIEDVDNFLDYLCVLANKRNIYFLWRPFLKDIKDDMVLELAVESESEFIVTHNLKDFKQAKEFGIPALSPKEFLKLLEKSK